MNGGLPLFPPTASSADNNPPASDDDEETIARQIWHWHPWLTPIHMKPNGGLPLFPPPEAADPPASDDEETTAMVLINTVAPVNYFVRGLKKL